MITISGSQFSEQTLTAYDKTGTSNLQQVLIEARVRRDKPVFSRMKMRGICALFLFLLISISIPAQIVTSTDTAAPDKNTVNKQLKEIKKENIQLHSDSTGGEPKKTTIDTTVKNKYNDLLNDDPIYNKQYPLWKPAVEVFGINATVFLLDRYAGKYDFSTSVGFSSWKHNIKTGWVWDKDRFGINFIGHPYTGSLYFNAARSSGYSFWQSFPYAVGGSVLWEYFGENTLPSYNDVINTPINGAFLGEIFYRISSNILDDRSVGAQRFFRELAAGIIDPARGFNRLLQGKSFRRTNKEVYQKEPLNITIFSGVQKLNKVPVNINKIGTGNEIFDLQLDYGNPFEDIKRKPYDLFRFRIDLSFGKGRKILDNVIGYGILTGKNFHSDSGDRAILVGAYQYYDYWDNVTFELGAVGFGGGIITKLPVHIGSKSNLYTSLHLAIVPFAGNSTRYGPDTASQFRDYNFGGGLEGKFESSLNFDKWATATLAAYYYWTHSYIGLKEDNLLAIIKPRITIRIIKNLSVGYEQAFYSNNIHSPDLPVLHINRTEQKIFLMLYLEDKQRRGHYN